MPRAKSTDQVAEADLNRRFGQRLQATRLSRGLVLADVAARIGVSYQAYQKYEQGRNAVSYPRLVALAKALDIEITELVAPEVKLPSPDGPVDRRLRELTRSFPDLTDRDQNLVLHVLRDLAAR